MCDETASSAFYSVFLHRRLFLSVRAAVFIRRDWLADQFFARILGKRNNFRCKEVLYFICSLSRKFSHCISIPQYPGVCVREILGRQRGRRKCTINEEADTTTNLNFAKSSPSTRIANRDGSASAANARCLTDFTNSPKRPAKRTGLPHMPKRRLNVGVNRRGEVERRRYLTYVSPLPQRLLVFWSSMSACAAM